MARQHWIHRCMLIHPTRTSIRTQPSQVNSCGFRSLNSFIPIAESLAADIFLTTEEEHSNDDTTDARTCRFVTFQSCIQLYLATPTIGPSLEGLKPDQQRWRSSASCSDPGRIHPVNIYGRISFSFIFWACVNDAGNLTLTSIMKSPRSPDFLVGIPRFGYRSS